MPTSLDLYRVTGTAGKVGTPGAPILHFDLLVNSNTGAVSGHASITQALPPPAGEILINNVTGKARKTIFGGTVTLAVSLQGTYEVKAPPTDHIILEHFQASFVVNVQWDGRGGFDYGSHSVDDVPVKSTVSPDSGPPHIVPLYGVVIHEAVASGDLARMKGILTQAEAHIAKTPEVQAALPALKAAIAKAGG
jgi:hypothetical protein